MSSINSEENKINIKKYTNKLKDLGYSSDNKVRGSFYSLNEASSVPLIKNKIMQMQMAELKTPHAADLSMQDLDSHLTPHKTMKITIQQLNNLECKESQNFGEVGESIINRTSNKILNGRNFMNDNPFLFQEFSKLDLSSEYDEEQMNERSDSKPKPTKVVNKRLPESSRVNSQFKVMRGAIKKSGALKFNMITNKPSPSSVQPQIKHKFLNNIQEEPGIKNSKSKVKADSKSTGKITFLVRDDA